LAAQSRRPYCARAIFGGPALFLDLFVAVRLVLALAIIALRGGVKLNEARALFALTILLGGRIGDTPTIFHLSAARR
jgi:hypothetical protein